jgi:hypothetical protein
MQLCGSQRGFFGPPEDDDGQQPDSPTPDKTPRAKAKGKGTSKPKA